MKTLAISFGEAYPKFSPKWFEHSFTIEEPENAGKPNKLKSLRIYDVNGYVYPHELAKATSSFASRSTEGYSVVDYLLTKDCDQIVMFEREGQKYVAYNMWHTWS